MIQAVILILICGAHAISRAAFEKQQLHLTITAF